MSSILFGNITLSIFGESHGKCIGGVIDNFPCGVEIDFEYIKDYMKRRAPGASFSTKRIEPDAPIIMSGVKDGVTTGAPIMFYIQNQNNHSADYGEELILPRPNHADYPAYVKYSGFADFHGGGHFSGRLTAPIVFSGALAMLCLREKGIEIAAHIKQCGNVFDDSFDFTSVSSNFLKRLKEKVFPCINDVKSIEIQNEITLAQKDGDSVGAVIECAAVGIPCGLGSHMFASAEAKISSAIFGIPAVKGIEFGLGFDFASSHASSVNDEFYYDENKNVRTKTNNCGGILGGMTSGMPLVFSVAFKPTPSIFKVQNTINLKTKENAVLNIKGRHDPCIAYRAVPCVECACALAVLDMMLQQ